MASLYFDKRRGRYYIGYKDVDGRRKQVKGGKNKKFAEIKRADIERRIECFEVGIVRPKKVLFKDFSVRHLEYEQAKDLAPRWFKRKKALFKYQFNPFLGNKFIYTIDVRDLRNYFQKRTEDGISATTKNLERSVLKGLFDQAISEEICSVNPLSGLKRARQAEPATSSLTDEEASSLRAAARELNCPHLEVAVDLGLYCGLRKGEILSLPKSAIKDGQVTVSNQKHWKTKSRKNRSIPINSTLGETLDRFIPHVRTKTLLWHGDGKPVKDLRRQLAEAYRRAGIPEERSGLKILRHTFAQNCLRSGMNIYMLKELMGHSSIKVTERYLHSAPTEEKRTAIEKISG